jgi:hypothetical protein
MNRLFMVNKDQWVANSLWQHLAPDEQQYGIDSVQNGILLASTLHRYWDSWWMSLNPVLLFLMF